MEQLLTVLPNLSIGVVCIGALVYVVILFVRTLDGRAVAHEKAMKEREDSMRGVEASVRHNLTDVLTKATIAIESNSRVMERVMRKLDT